MVTFRLETETTVLDARKAAAEAALAQSHQRTHVLELESADNLGASRSPSPPCKSLRRSPRRSPSPPSEVAALTDMQILQRQQQHVSCRGIPGQQSLWRRQEAGLEPHLAVLVHRRWPRAGRLARIAAAEVKSDPIKTNSCSKQQIITTNISNHKQQTTTAPTNEPP